MSILLSISASMFIRENDLKFSFFVESLGDLCLQTRACCPLRDSTQQLTQIDIDNHSQTVDGAWVFL